jgi:hypothetical protein
MVVDIIDFPKRLQLKKAELISDDAIEYAGRDKIGAYYVSRGIDGDPHAGYNAKHRAADDAMESAFDKYVANHGITKDNPMSVKQLNDFLNEASKQQAIRAFWDSIGEFVAEQSRLNRPNVNRLIRGSGAKSSDQ